jgi:hypothetical protein
VLSMAHQLLNAVDRGPDSMQLRVVRKLKRGEQHRP